MNCQEMIFCKKDVMSVCIATDKAEQKMCRFYERSFNVDRCMYFVLGEFCDNLNAQVFTKNQGLS
jgi:hypothetical protein